MCVVACSPGYLRCVAGGSCLSSEQRCNGRCDCPYCTDELNCYTPPSYPNITTRQPSTTLQSSQLTSTHEPMFSASKSAVFLHFYVGLSAVDSAVNVLVGKLTETTACAVACSNWNWHKTCSWWQPVSLPVLAVSSVTSVIICSSIFANTAIRLYCAKLDLK